MSSRSDAKFASEISVLLLLVSLAGIALASEMTSTVDALASSPGGERSFPSDTNTSGSWSDSFNELNYTGAKKPDNIGLFRIPLIGQIKDSGFRVATADK